MQLPPTFLGSLPPEMYKIISIAKQLPALAQDAWQR
jgi:hypothetical protein